MLTFIGKGSAFNLKDGSNSAYFIKNNNLYLIDCGETVFLELNNRVDFSSFASVYVLLTHLHCDHIASLGTLISYLSIKLNIKPIVVHPLETAKQVLDLTGINAQSYDYVQVKDFNNGDVLLFFIETSHVDNMKCYGLLIEHSGTTIYYSGDANIIPAPILEQFLNNSIDRLYQDTTVCCGEHLSHLSLEQLQNLIPLTHRKNVYCMHLDENSSATIEAQGFHCVSVD